jgi:hypothetical protein
MTDDDDDDDWDDHFLIDCYENAPWWLWLRLAGYIAGLLGAGAAVPVWARIPFTWRATTNIDGAAACEMIAALTACVVTGELVNVGKLALEYLRERDDQIRP